MNIHYDLTFNSALLQSEFIPSLLFSSIRKYRNIVNDFGKKDKYSLLLKIQLSFKYKANSFMHHSLALFKSIEDSYNDFKRNNQVILG